MEEPAERHPDEHLLGQPPRVEDRRVEVSFVGRRAVELRVEGHRVGELRAGERRVGRREVHSAADLGEDWSEEVRHEVVVRLPAEELRAVVHLLEARLAEGRPMGHSLVHRSQASLEALPTGRSRALEVPIGRSLVHHSQVHPEVDNHSLARLVLCHMLRGEQPLPDPALQVHRREAVA